MDLSIWLVENATLAISNDFLVNLCKFSKKTGFVEHIYHWKQLLTWTIAINTDVCVLKM